MDPISLILGGVAVWFFLKGPGANAAATTTSIATGYGPDANAGPATNMPAGGSPGAPTSRAAQAGDTGANTPVQNPSGGGAPSVQITQNLDNLGNYYPPGGYGRGYGNWGNGTPYDSASGPTKFSPIFVSGGASVTSPEYSTASSNGGMAIGSGYR